MTCLMANISLALHRLPFFATFTCEFRNFANISQISILKRICVAKCFDFAIKLRYLKRCRNFFATSKLEGKRLFMIKYRPLPDSEFFLPNGFAHCEFLAPPCSVCDQLECSQSTTRVLQRHNAPSACSETT